jgi:hypothetical protein
LGGVPRVESNVGKEEGEKNGEGSLSKSVGGIWRSEGALGMNKYNRGRGRKVMS